MLQERLKQDMQMVMFSICFVNKDNLDRYDFSNLNVCVSAGGYENCIMSICQPDLDKSVFTNTFGCIFFGGI